MLGGSWELSSWKSYRVLSGFYRLLRGSGELLSRVISTVAIVIALLRYLQPDVLSPLNLKVSQQDSQVETFRV